MSADRPDVLSYLLGELEPEQLAAAERLALGDPAFRAEAARLRPLVQRLDGLSPEAWSAPEPPPPLAIAPELPAAPTRRARAPRRRLVLRPAFAALASVLLLAAGVGGGAVLRGGGGDGAGASVALSRPEALPANVDPAARGRANLVSNGTRRLAIDVSGLAPTGGDTYYEVWLMDAGGDLVSIGSFAVPRSGHAVLQVPLPVDPRSYEFVDVSLERRDGNPGHSSVSVLRAPTATLAPAGAART